MSSSNGLFHTCGREEREVDKFSTEVYGHTFATHSWPSKYLNPRDIRQPSHNSSRYISVHSQWPRSLEYPGPLRISHWPVVTVAALVPSRNVISMCLGRNLSTVGSLFRSLLNSARQESELEEMARPEIPVHSFRLFSILRHSCTSKLHLCHPATRKNGPRRMSHRSHRSRTVPSYNVVFLFWIRWLVILTFSSSLILSNYK